MISFAEPDPDWYGCYQIPAGGRRMEMDWDHVARAFEAAQAQLGWDAEVVLTPKRRGCATRDWPSGPTIGRGASRARSKRSTSLPSSITSVDIGGGSSPPSVLRVLCGSA